VHWHKCEVPTGPEIVRLWGSLDVYGCLGDGCDAKIANSLFSRVASSLGVDGMTCAPPDAKARDISTI
jgi:hypothetical protein